MRRGILVIALAAATTGALFWWGRQAIATPVCEAVARAEGLRFDGYIPIELGRKNRNDPDGNCRLIRADGGTVTRSLSRHLHGWQHLLSLTMRYDLMFLGTFVLWGLFVGMLSRRRPSSS